MYQTPIHQTPVRRTALMSRLSSCEVIFLTRISQMLIREFGLVIKGFGVGLLVLHRQTQAQPTWDQQTIPRLRRSQHHPLPIPSNTPIHLRLDRRTQNRKSRLRIRPRWTLRGLPTKTLLRRHLPNKRGLAHYSDLHAPPTRSGSQSAKPPFPPRHSRCPPSSRVLPRRPRTVRR